MLMAAIMLTSVLPMSVMAEEPEEQIQENNKQETKEKKDTEKEPKKESEDEKKEEETKENQEMQVPMTTAPAPEGTALSGNIGSDYTITESGKYYLDSDIVTGNIIIGENAVVTLDLCGHVLKASNETEADAYTIADSVITVHGDFTLTDNNKTTTHYFKVDEKNLWNLDTEATEGIPFEEVKETPETGDVIALKGGAVTGGKGNHVKDTLRPGTGIGFNDSLYGGGIFCDGKLTIDGASVCGNEIKLFSGHCRYGAGIFVCENASCTMKNNAIVCGNSIHDVDPANQTSIGGGIDCCGTLDISTGSAVSFNTSYSSAGGIELFKTGAAITDSTMRGNVSEYTYGGCIGYMGGDNGILKMERCTVENNHAEVGGGIHMIAPLDGVPYVNYPRPKGHGLVTAQSY